MDVVTIRQNLPELRRPVLLAAFRGWNDAGQAASSAVDMLAEEIGTESFAYIDAEEFFDFQVTRPVVRRDEHDRRMIDWPVNDFSWGSIAGVESDVIVLTGSEPNLRWRSFTDGIVGLARDLGVELVATLGALQVDAPHTRPVPVTGSTSPEEMGTNLGLRPSRYEGPTGITGVLHDACVNAGLQAASLWAGVPHYLATANYQAATLALAERAARLLRADLSLASLAGEAAVQREELDDLVAEDDELSEYVAELETRIDEAPDKLPDRPVSGDELAAAFERYLRDRGSS